MDSWGNNPYFGSPSMDVWDEMPSETPYGSYEEPFYLLSSQPLSRHASSEGSVAYPLSLPDSPMSNNLGSVHSSPVFDPSDTVPMMVPANIIPEFALTPQVSPPVNFPMFFPTQMEIPRTVPFPQRAWNPARPSDRDYPLICLFPHCSAKPFRRRADLERHYRNRHEPDSRREVYRCDYSRCSRKIDPFHRRDHFRDHLRDYHHEDIEKRGVAVSEDWYNGRNIAAAWWRCNKCLDRVSVKMHGWDCPICKAPCHEIRRRIREAKARLLEARQQSA